MLLVFTYVENPATGVVQNTGWALWPIFGASNQMLAALTLMVLTLYFWKRQKPILPLLIPMLLIMLITFTALIIKAQTFFSQGNGLLFSINMVMIVLMNEISFTIKDNIVHHFFF